MRKKSKIKLGIWKEGDYFDLWSLVHFLGGILLGFFPILLDIKVERAFIVVLSIVVLWEVFEYIRGVRETTGNRVVDILVAVIGFGFTTVVYSAIPTEMAVISGLALLAIFVALNTAGWHTWARRR